MTPTLQAWDLPSSDFSKLYTIRHYQGRWWCSCPRMDPEKGGKDCCKHVLEVKRIVSVLSSHRVEEPTNLEHYQPREVEL